MDLRTIAKQTGICLSAVKEAMKGASSRCLEEVEHPYLIKTSDGCRTIIHSIRYYDTLNKTYYSDELKAYVLLNGEYIEKDLVSEYKIFRCWNFSRNIPKTVSVVMLKEEAMKRLVKDAFIADLYYYRTIENSLPDPTVNYAVGIGWVSGNVTYPSETGFKRSQWRFVNQALWPIEQTIDVWRPDSEFCVAGLKLDMERHPEKYWVCPDCGKIFFEKENHDHVCSCQMMRIYPYHSWDGKRLFMKGSSEKTPKQYFGVEIETEGSEMNRKYVSSMRDVFHLEHDGSLGYGSFEMISQPMTWQYIMENKSRFEKMFKNLSDHGQKSHDTTTCGLHIHVSRTAFKNPMAEDRFKAIVNCLSKDMETFARRKGTRYCAYQSLCGEKVTKENIAYYQTNEGHHCAVNCGCHSSDGNRDTIEVRIFRGTLNPLTFFATVELVKNLVEVSNNEHRMRVAFKDLVFGDYVPVYVEERKARGFRFDISQPVDFSLYFYARSKEKLDAFKDLRRSVRKLKNISPTLAKTIIEKVMAEGGDR